MVALAGLPLVDASPVGAQPPDDRYALAHGCYVVRSANGTDGPFRFQATDLGRYLLLDQDNRFASATGRVDTADPNADWQVDEIGGGFRLWLPNGGQEWPGGGLVSFEEAEGCAEFPEVDVNVSGAPVRGATPYEEVTGYIDPHLHVTAHEFLGGRAHCGRPWHPYGVTAALVDCPDHALTGGAGAVMENFFSAGVPVGTHDTVGWPTFRDWPAPSSLTHEQTYYRWLERAWRGGLRIFTNLLVENRVLCEIYPLKLNSCDEMDSVRLQARRLRELERYVDAQSGGPGEGWFRIVDDPFEARRVANGGKLAVVLGVEISELFGCSQTLGQPNCTAADIDAQLDELDALGIRQLVVIHKFDNALGGVAFDGGVQGTIVNFGNFYGTGQWWTMETCDPENTGVHDNDQSLPGDLHELTGELGALLTQLAPGGLPVYPPPHHCNPRGLSALGAHAVQGMVDRQMLVDIDHMSVKARQQALGLLEADGYSGVVSSHSWATPDAYPRVSALGGFQAPYAGGSAGFVDAWRDRKATADPRYPFGIGYGADSNGLGTQGGPRSNASENPVTYPFTGLGGVVIDQQVSGERVYDINVDGVAHYGLYPDWIEDLRMQAGDEIVADLARGAEAYLQTWERAVGVAGPGCRAPAVLSDVRSGMTPEEVLHVAGQPDERAGATFTYCVEGADDVVVAFDATGRVAAAPIVPAPRPEGVPGRLPATGGPGLWPMVAAALIALALGVRRLGSPT